MNQTPALEVTLREFLRLAEIPHPSHHEGKLAAYLLQWAADHGLNARQDSLGDVIIDKPASPGCEGAPRVILQAHMDMVCVAAEGVAFDPLTDPIRVVNDGKTLTAQGTSLGADDGIGVALCLYVLQDKTLRHGPLRVLLTVNEEDGMSAIALEPAYLDADYLINLDWEWLGSLCNSSAGGDFLTLTRAPRWTAPASGHTAIQVALGGLLGGHSGVDIHRGRANALVCVATALLRLTEAGIPFALASFTGGQARNAIPAAAEATIAVASADVPRALDALHAYGAAFRIGFGNVEADHAYTVRALDAPVPRVLDNADADALLALLAVLPCNVHTMSPFIPTLVESSQNLGQLTMDDTAITLFAMLRSSDAYRGEELIRATRLAAGALGFTLQQGDHIPAWAVNPNSRLTPLACQCYRTLTGNEMVIEPIHGGLECGAFFEKNPNLDMIAIGPSITDVHTPAEACDLHSVDLTAQLLTAILEKLTGG